MYTASSGVAGIKHKNENPNIDKMFLSITIVVFLSLFSKSLAAECPKIVTQKDFNATRVHQMILFFSLINSFSLLVFRSLV